MSDSSDYEAGEQGQEFSGSGDEESSEVDPPSSAADGEESKSLVDGDRATSRNRRLEYLRSADDADYAVHVLSTSADSDDVTDSVCYKKIPCHRLFLASASEKLEEYVSQDDKGSGVLQINGVSTQSVEIFLEFVYTFDLSPTVVQLPLTGDIFVLSCAYDMPELLHCYLKKLKTQDWPLDDIFPAFDLAFRCNIGELERVCMEKIIQNAAQLAQEPSLMQLKVYALNCVIQNWLAADLVPQDEIINILQRYQNANEITFANSQFLHFSKIINQFPSILLDSEGLISSFS